MKTVKTLLIIMIFTFLPKMNAQEARVSHDGKVEAKHTLSYYQQRGREDAQYAQKFTASTKAEERVFWKEQKQYEKDLRKENRRGYKVYIQAKNDSYAEHQHNCNGNCHHSDYWYENAAHYHYEYRQPRYENRSSNATVKTQIGVSAPKVRVGIF